MHAAETGGSGGFSAALAAAPPSASLLLGACLTYLYLTATASPPWSTSWQHQPPDKRTANASTGCPLYSNPGDLAPANESLRGGPRVAARRAPLLNAAFVILVGPGVGMAELIDTLPRLWDNFLWQFPYPVWLIMGEDVDPYQVNALLNGSATRHILPLVRYLDDGGLLAFPPAMRKADFLPEDVVWPFRYPGYHHMCRFWALDVWNHPQISQLDYYCRLDTHSWINTPIRYDMFRHMASMRRSYGYNEMRWDDAAVTVGMWEFAMAYDASHATNASLNKVQWPDRPRKAGRLINKSVRMYYTNFEVVRVAAFQGSTAISAFNAAVDATNAIYRWRWGDAPLRWLQVQLFMDVERDTWRFRDFEYTHPWNWTVVDFRKKCECCPVCKHGSHDNPDTLPDTQRSGFYFNEQTEQWVWVGNPDD